MSKQQPLRPFQHQALTHLQNPCDLICVAPTGSGKSRIYEIASRQLARRSVLITPLLALGHQQLGVLGGIPGLQSSACLSTRPREQRFPPNLRGDESGIWIVSPEALRQPHWRRALISYLPDFLVIDECHCIWDWGREFRPAYAEVLSLYQELKDSNAIARSLWLTATLLPHERAALKRNLHRPVELGEFALPSGLELQFERIEPSRRLERFWTWLHALQGSGIVFVSTRQSAERVTRLLQARGWPAFAYHSGLTPESRRALETRFRSPGRKFIVATSAFGMGMDIDDLEWALLWELPYSVVDLAQRVGRIGRLSQRARHPRALLFWHEDEWRGFALSPERLALLHMLNEPGCRRAAFARVFEAKSSESSGNCCNFCNSASWDRARSPMVRGGQDLQGASFG